MTGQRKDTTQAVMDGLLQFLLAGGTISAALVAPNAVQLFGKPLDKLYKNLDKRSRERELRRVIYYMKQRGLIHYKPDDYEHGIKLTKAGKKYMKRQDFGSLSIEKPAKWDNMWRLVFFDIPESQRSKRQSLTYKLRTLGFRQLQYSIWVHPFPCRAEIEAITAVIGVRRFVTYVEINHIDNDKELRAKFTNLLKS